MASMANSTCRCFSTVARRQMFSSSSAAWAATASTSQERSKPAQAPKPILPDLNHVDNPRLREALKSTFAGAAFLAGNSPERVLGQARSSSSASLSESSSSSSLTSSDSAAIAVPATPVPTPRTFTIAPIEDPLLTFLTNLMMKDGKKATARNHVSLVLSTLRLKTSQDPLPLLREAIRLAAPSIRMTQQKRGGKQVGVPRALNERQRVHKAIEWILDASDRRKNPNAGGSKRFGERVAIEIEAVLNGTSDVLKKKEQLHTLGTVNRANVASRP